MPKAVMTSTCTFHGVGQGLFSSGYIQMKVGTNGDFRWVYDCGTSSRRGSLTAAIQRLVHETASTVKGTKRPRLGLVVVSHFDGDHVNGLAVLLSSFSVGVLLLPYVPLAQRILAAYASGIDSQDDLMQFFIDPVGYISRGSGVEIDQIVLVPPSTGDGPASGEPQEPDLVSEGPWDARVSHAAPEGDEQKEDWATFQASRAKGVKAVEFIKARSSIQVRNAWEFVPYNDPSVQPKSPKRFTKAAIALRKDLAGSAGDKATRALAKLRKLYDKQFGKSGFKRNVISLFIYAGPTESASSKPIRSVETFLLRHEEPIVTATRSIVPMDEARRGVLYTGDGFLDTASRIRSVIQVLGRPRIDALSCLQVMHHGARDNWCPGLAKKLAPTVSVFSSDPKAKRPGHPHPDVVRDFLACGPVQVDAATSFLWRVTVVYP